MSRHLPMLLVAALATGFAISKHTRAEDRATTGPQPKSLQASETRPKSAPKDKLLLLDDDASDKAPAASGAGNDRCLICHLNFAQEKLTAIHARHQIGCAKCHGASDAHIADESWASGSNGTAPDRMYRKENINAFCLTCHPRKRIDNELHKPFLTGATREKHCTDCHGKHRMASRRCKWK